MRETALRFNGAESAASPSLSRSSLQQKQPLPPLGDGLPSFIGPVKTGHPSPLYRPLKTGCPSSPMAKPDGSGSGSPHSTPVPPRLVSRKQHVPEMLIRPVGQRWGDIPHEPQGPTPSEFQRFPWSRAHGDLPSTTKNTLPLRNHLPWKMMPQPAAQGSARTTAPPACKRGAAKGLAPGLPWPDHLSLSPAPAGRQLRDPRRTHSVTAALLARPGPPGQARGRGLHVVIPGGAWSLSPRV